jgi:nucleoside-diphosphate-sugar epimerase
LKREIVAWLAQQLGVPEPVFSGTPAAGRRTITPDRLIVNAKLKSVLGWNPHYPTFREGYKNMLALGSE